MESPDDELRTVWSSLGGDAEEAVIERLLALYAEPGRHYHTAAHVAAVLRHGDLLLADSGDVPVVSDMALDDDVVRAGALFHDAIYDPRSTTNEADSARMAVDAMAVLGWSGHRLALLSEIILATATHVAVTAESAVLLDADLAILGAAPDVYRRYVADVRAEYAFVDDDQWVEGRTAVLHHLLDRPTLYATTAMRTAREAQARSNIRQELGRRFW